MLNRYSGWTRIDNGLSYLISPDKVRIAYDLNGKMVELTWKRTMGGYGPQLKQSMKDYVSYRLRGSAGRKETMALTEILVDLEKELGKKA
jgi:hypothetical protein